MTVDVTLGEEGKSAELNRAKLRSVEQLRREFSTLVFTPDRLAVVKGGPAVRRSYLDRSVARLFPSRAAIPVEYLSAIGQRNAALRRVAAAQSSLDAVAPWTEQVVQLGGTLVAAREEAIGVLARGFAEHAEAFGLSGCTLEYEGESPSRDALEARLTRDVERGTTGLGPHLDDVAIRAGSRDLRTFGSQGEQRLAVLSLLLAEAEALREQGGIAPLLLLDDVLSELDQPRRAALSDRLSGLGQTVVTATAAEALPTAPAQLLEVTPGYVRVVS
jgi:DNA replication and repair protein RecF